MAKGKKKKGGETPDHVPEQSEEPMPPAQEKTDKEFLEKYTGENSQAIGFRNIIRAQSKYVMEETIAQEIQKATSSIQLQLKQAMDTIEDLKSENQKRDKRIEKMEFMLQNKYEKIEELLVQEWFRPSVICLTKCTFLVRHIKLTYVPGYVRYLNITSHPPCMSKFQDF